MSGQYAHLRWVAKYDKTFVLEILVMYDSITERVPGVKSVLATPVLLLSGDRNAYEDGVKFGPDSYSESYGWVITPMQPL